MLGVATLVGVAFLHLERYPRPFFDEGSYLQVAGNLARNALYAEYGNEAPSYYGGPIGVGPTVHLPVALAFRLLGAGIWPGRAVIALFFVASAVVFWVLARLLGGPRLAWLSLALALTTPALAYVPLGRQVMGEVPGLFFVLAGLLLWFQRWDRHTTASLAAVGLLFGLGAVSKNQFALVLDLSLAACLVLNLFDVFGRPRLPHRWFAVPLLVTVACHAGWSAIYLLAIPPDGRAEIAACGPAISAATTTRWPEAAQIGANLSALLRPAVYFGLLFPALAFGVLRARSTTREESRWTVVLVVALVNFAWYAFLTIGWRRYLFLGLALSSLLVARVVLVLVTDTAMRGLRVIVIAWVAGGIAVCAFRLAGEILWPLPADAENMAAWLGAHLPRDAVVETWEPEIVFLSDLRFHSHTCRMLPAAIAYRHFDRQGRAPFTQDDVLRDRPPRYLLLGEFAVFVRAYDFERMDREYRRVHHEGPYVLYERIATP